MCSRSITLAVLLVSSTAIVWAPIELLASTIPCGYLVEKQAPLCLGGVSGYGVSTNGSVTGFFSCAISGIDYAFVWHRDGVTIIPTPPGFSDARGLSISSFGDVSGRIQTADFVRHGLLYSDGKSFDLGTLPGENNAEGLGIAPTTGVVVGYSHDFNTGPPKAVMWKNRTITALELPLGPSSTAEDVNDKLQIVGRMGSITTTHAYIWDNAVVTDLGVFPNGITSHAFAINENSDVVGRGRLPLPGGLPGQMVYHAFGYFDGVMTDIGTCMGYDESEAFDLNDDRIVVGTCSESTTGELPAGFVWRDGKMTVLNDLIDDDSIEITQVRSINQAGQIAGTGRGLSSSDGFAVLLTPIWPVPGDADCNKIVDVDDLLTVINGWGTCKKFSPCPGDLLENDVVDVDDLLMVINNWTPPQ